MSRFLSSEVQLPSRGPLVTRFKVSNPYPGFPACEIHIQPTREKSHSHLCSLICQLQHTASFQTTQPPLTSSFVRNTEADASPLCPPTSENVYHSLQINQLESPALNLREAAGIPLSPHPRRTSSKKRIFASISLSLFNMLLCPRAGHF